MIQVCQTGTACLFNSCNCPSLQHQLLRPPWQPPRSTPPGRLLLLLLHLPVASLSCSPNRLTLCWVQDAEGGMRKSRSFVRPPLGRQSGEREQPSSPRVPNAPHRLLSPKDGADKGPVKAAKLHPGIDALLNPRHPGATPYRVVLGASLTLSCACAWIWLQ